MSVLRSLMVVFLVLPSWFLVLLAFCGVPAALPFGIVGAVVGMVLVYALGASGRQDRQAALIADGVERALQARGVGTAVAPANSDRKPADDEAGW